MQNMFCGNKRRQKLTMGIKLGDYKYLEIKQYSCDNGSKRN